jgi:transposase-like protein
MNEIKAKGLDSQATVRAVARALGISRSTFYRKCYDKIVKSFYRDATLRKDSRAKKLYADQVLQETDVNDQRT